MPTYWLPSPWVMSNCTVLSPQDPGFMDPEACSIWRALHRRGEGKLDTKLNTGLWKDLCKQDTQGLNCTSFLGTWLGDRSPLLPEMKLGLREVQWLAQSYSCGVAHSRLKHEVADPQYPVASLCGVWEKLNCYRFIKRWPYPRVDNIPFFLKILTVILNTLVTIVCLQTRKHE